VKLHRCNVQWLKIGAHPCWRVEQALIEMGVDYERVPGPVRRGQRDALQELSGQRQYPVLELEDGTIWREESKQMAAAIRGGKLATTA
jgi:glutathione S-transferase